MFSYTRRVHFYETDQMGIVHHSNYLRFYEEARVAWAHQYDLIDYQKPESAAHFAVLETQVKHLKPAFFGDVLRVEVQARQLGAKIEFEYRILKNKDNLKNNIGKHSEILVAEWLTVSTAKTIHVPLNAELKPIRVPKSMKEVLEKELWKETWL